MFLSSLEKVMGQFKLLHCLALTSTIAFSVDILAMPQEAAAGVVSANVSTEFNLQFGISNLAGDFMGVEIFTPGSVLGSTNAQVDGNPDSDNFGSFPCPIGVDPASAVSTVVIPFRGASEATSLAECNDTLNLANTAVAISTPTTFGVQTSSFADSTYFFSGSIIPEDEFTILSIQGTFEWDQEVVIVGWNPPEEKSSRTFLAGAITLENTITGEESLLEVFTDDLVIENRNDILTDPGFQTIDLLVPLGIEIGIEYSLNITSIITASTRAEQILPFTIPEPTSIIGFFVTCSLGLGLKKRK